MNKASFSQFLREQCKYKENNLRESTYRYQGVTYNRVEALDNDTIIQAFVIMSERQVAECEKFPFYRSYYQRNDYGYIVPPACNIAVFHKDDGEWHIHSASDPKLELTNPDFLNYDKAVERFRNRFSFCGNQKLARQIKRLSWICCPHEFNSAYSFCSYSSITVVAPDGPVHQKHYYKRCRG